MADLFQVEGELMIVLSMTVLATNALETLYEDIKESKVWGGEDLCNAAICGLLEARAHLDVMERQLQEMRGERQAAT
mgnify:FL=1